MIAQPRCILGEQFYEGGILLNQGKVPLLEPDLLLVQLACYLTDFPITCPNKEIRELGSQLRRTKFRLEKVIKHFVQWAFSSKRVFGCMESLQLLEDAVRICLSWLL